MIPSGSAGLIVYQQRYRPSDEAVTTGWMIPSGSAGLIVYQQRYRPSDGNNNA
jgi:hypothetical protein